MKISIKTRQRPLSIFNEVKSEKIKVYSIQLYCNDRGKVYYLTTGMTTENMHQDNEVFNDRGVSRRMNEARSKALKDLVERCNLWALQNPDETIEERKKNLTALVKGEEDAKIPNGLADFVAKYAMRFDDEKGTKPIWENTEKKIRAYDPKATFDSVDEIWLMGWEMDMRSKGLKTNSLSIHMRNLRTAFNWAKKKKWTENYPFDFYTIKSERTWKLALTAQQFADMRDWPVDDWQKRYRDMFVLMVYLGGLDIVDLAGLKDENLKNGRLHFFRTKNVGRAESVEVTIPVMPEAMVLIKKYKGKDGYLLDIMNNRSDYHSYGKSMLKALKKIGWSERVKDKVGKMRKVVYHAMFDGIEVKTARRSFDTIAKRLKIPPVLIGMCMGHAWAAENTTEMYDRFEYEDQVDAMREFIDHLNSLKGRGKDEIFVDFDEE